MVQDSSDSCNSIMTTLHCPKTFNCKLLVLEVVYICVTRLFTNVYKLDKISCHSDCVRLFLYWQNLGAAEIATKIIIFNPPLYQNTNLALRRN